MAGPYHNEIEDIPGLPQIRVFVTDKAKTRNFPEHLYRKNPGKRVSKSVSSNELQRTVKGGDDMGKAHKYDISGKLGVDLLCLGWGVVHCQEDAVGYNRSDDEVIKHR